jgi:hypothetical protein
MLTAATIPIRWNQIFIPKGRWPLRGLESTIELRSGSCFVDYIIFSIS